jgi:hypothetical protein
MSSRSTDDSEGSVLLELRCERRRHLVAEVVESVGSDTFMIEARRYCAGSTKDSWTPASFPLVMGSGHRYGCACGPPSALVRDDDLAKAIASGTGTYWIVC